MRLSWALDDSMTMIGRSLRHIPRNLESLLMAVTAEVFRQFSAMLREAIEQQSKRSKLSRFAQVTFDFGLRRIGVEVRLGSMVTAIDEGIVQMGADSVRASTMIWAAGVRASPLTGTTSQFGRLAAS